MNKTPLRVVVRLEISTLYDTNGKFDNHKLDRLAMIISNMNNSGMEILLVSSGAIALGADKLETPIPESSLDMQATAAVGQVELMKLYQQYFDQYNQMSAQVLLTSDIMENETRVKNTQNTFNRLLEHNVLPIINENDPVSTSDIELDDNYPLALNVAKISDAHMIIIKTDNVDQYILVPRGRKAFTIDQDKELFMTLYKYQKETENLTEGFFPPSIGELEFENEK